MKNFGLNIYLLLIVSWFLHFGSRLPFLGVIRFDLLLILILTVTAFLTKNDDVGDPTPSDKLLKYLIIYSILTIPFVEWPGSVIRFGIPNLIKAIIFYYFTIRFIKTEKDLSKMIFVFLTCQLWRVLEPVYLHLTTGYWGSGAHIGGGEFLERLSGAPHDIVNPNGLAFIICTVIPFLYFFRGLSRKYWLVYVLFTPILIYALILTNSRSGILALVIIILGMIVKSKRRIFLLLSCVIAIVIGFSYLPTQTQDRYLSLIGKGERNIETAQGRIEGVKSNLSVIMNRPIFGHGLGTSREANANFGGMDQPAHNLYVEILQEIGLIGLVIFILFIRSIFRSFNQAKELYKYRDPNTFLDNLIDAMQVWLFMNLLFSFASYGLTSYEWYLFAGFSVAVQHLSEKGKLNETAGSKAAHA